MCSPNSDFSFVRILCLILPDVIDTGNFFIGSFNFEFSRIFLKMKIRRKNQAQENFAKEKNLDKT